MHWHHYLFIREQKGRTHFSLSCCLNNYLGSLFLFARLDLYIDKIGQGTEAILSVPEFNFCNHDVNPCNNNFVCFNLFLCPIQIDDSVCSNIQSINLERTLFSSKYCFAPNERSKKG